MDKDIIIALIGAFATITAAVINSQSRNKKAGEATTQEGINPKPASPIMEALTFRILIPLILIFSLANLALSFTEKLQDLANKDDKTVVSDGSSNAETTIPAETKFNKELRPGTIMEFGSFEQDGNLENGPETIEWFVLDREEDRVLMISKMGLTSYQYENYNSKATWNSCSLRDWLNEDFFYEAFSLEDQALIIENETEPDSNPADRVCNQGSSITDHVFLLSASEYIEHMYGTETFVESERAGQPTVYAKTKNVDSYGQTGYCWWWLRTSSDENHYACTVTAFGVPDYFSKKISDRGGLVRPAIWITLE